MKKICFPMIASALLLAGPLLHANTVVFEENFDETTPQLGVTTAGQFTALNGTNVDIVAASNGWASLVVSPESGNVIDMGGTGSNPYGQIQAAIALTPGTYVLSFDLVGNQRVDGPDTTLVTLGTGSGGTGTISYNQAFTLGEFGLAGVGGVVTSSPITIGAGTEYLDFTDTDANGYDENIGSLLDDVTIAETTTPLTATPEPGTVFLLGTGILGLAYIVIRKAKPASGIVLGM